MPYWARAARASAVTSVVPVRACLRASWPWGPPSRARARKAGSSKPRSASRNSLPSTWPTRSGSVDVPSTRIALRRPLSVPLFAISISLPVMGVVGISHSRLAMRVDRNLEADEARVPGSRTPTIKGVAGAPRESSSSSIWKRRLSPGFALLKPWSELSRATTRGASSASSLLASAACSASSFSREVRSALGVALRAAPGNAIGPAGRAKVRASARWESMHLS